jgi:hypothetical protein
MRGILRPCRRRLGPELHERWQAHLCGSCLALRDVAGQPARIVTSRDAALASALVEAQAGPLPRRTAGPCPLRGGRTASVLRPDVPAARLAAAVGLLGGAAALDDKLGDREIPAVLRPAAGMVARRTAARGDRLATLVGLDARAILDAPADAARAEAAVADLDGVLAAAGRAAGAVFGATATIAGVPDNVGPLTRAGEAFGRLEHLLDAIVDRADDRRHGRFNPLEATATSEAETRAHARRLVDALRRELRDVQWTDPVLVDVLFGSELDHAVERAVGAEPEPRRLGGAVRRTVRAAAVAAGGVLATLLTAASMGPGAGGDQPLPPPPLRGDGVHEAPPSLPGRPGLPTAKGCRGALCDGCAEGCCDGICSCCG